MLGQARECKHESNGIHGREANSHVAPSADWVHGAVALGGVDEGSIADEKLGLVRLVRQVTAGIVGQGAIAIVGVVPVLEGGQVEVNASKDGVCAVVAAREGQQVPSVEDLETDHAVWLRASRRRVFLELSSNSESSLLSTSHG